MKKPKFNRLLLLTNLLLIFSLLILTTGALAAVDDSYTVALLHMNGDNNSTTFTDESGKTWTSHNGAKISTAEYVFGGASGYFDGINDYIDNPSSSDWSAGTGNYTIDFWAYFNAFPTSGNFMVFTMQYDGTNNWSTDIQNTSATYYLRFSNSSSGGSYSVVWFSGASSGYLNVWLHFAFVKSGLYRYIFVNGVQVGSTGVNIANPPSINQPFQVGGQSTLGRYFNGQIDELRVSKGYARWTSNFNPSGQEYGWGATPTETLTFTKTPTGTQLPTNTLTITPTYTNSPTYTLTVTKTPTVTPMTSIIWAPSPFSITNSLKNALATRLIAAPPTGSSENIYGIISAQIDDTGGWFVSLVNVVGIAAPYTNWDILSNSKWTGSMDCTGTEPTWTCAYYNPAPAFGAATDNGLVFPFQSGTFAVYGASGVHHDTGTALPGDDAVDFVGSDALASSMGPYAYAAESGTVTWSCQGADNGGIIITGPSGKIMYFHLAPGQAAFTIGTTFQQGQQIGRLAYGTFNDSPCGWASQNATDYHVHFAWVPSGSTFSIGGCILDLTTQNWLCGTTTIGILGHLNNSGGTSLPATVTPGGPTITPGGPTLTPIPGQIGQVVGGEHIWNGIIQAVIDFINTQGATLLPAYTTDTTISTAANNAWTTISDYAAMIQSLELIWSLPALFIYGIMLTVEIVRWVYAAYRLVIGLEPIK